MHSANRAKQRLQQRNASAHAELSSQSNETSSRRSKSLDRKSTLKRTKDLQSPRQSPKPPVMRGTTSSSFSGPGSDSGLSGLEVNSKKASSPTTAESDSIADSGRRSQSLEILSDDLRSMTLSSTPPSSSPSPRLAVSQAGSAISPATNKGHVHFMSVDNGSLSNPADIVRSMVSETELGTLRKSASIPVHLTVSSNNEVALPPALRPANGITIHCPLVEHEPDCATYKKKWASAQSLPATNNNARIHLHRTGTPTGETVSSLQKKKTRIINNGYSSLPRTPREKHLILGHHNEVSRSRSSASLSNETSRRPPSVASVASTSSGKRSSSGGGKKTMNASMSIWQIQKELKRGEMVQGVLHMGTFGRPSFGSRIKEREEETCICAPVVIGGKSGHMEWKRM